MLQLPLRSILEGFLLRIMLITMLVLASFPAAARDIGGRYAAMDLKTQLWFDKLASGRGRCCSFADGHAVTDVDWDAEACTDKRIVAGRIVERECHYRVRLNGAWIVVPDSVVVSEPNLYGAPVVWPYMDVDGQTQIRCFLPGAGG